MELALRNGKILYFCEYTKNFLALEIFGKILHLLMTWCGKIRHLKLTQHCLHVKTSWKAFCSNKKIGDIQ